MLGLGLSINKRGSASTSFLLEDPIVSTGLFAAYSVRKLSKDAEFVLQGYRVADSATRDFTEAELSDGTLATWSGGGDVSVSVFYNQGTNSTAALTHPTPSNRPLIVQAGVPVTQGGFPAIFFTNNILQTQLQASWPTTLCAVAVVKHSNTSFQIICSIANAPFFGVDGTTGKARLFSSGQILGNVVSTVNPSISSYRLDGSNSVVRQNGAQTASGTVTYVGSINLALYVGDRQARGIDLNSTLQELFVYTDSKTNEDLAYIEELCNEYFGVF